MRVSDFHFDLPEELIAQHPPAQRGSSRMLVLSRGQGTGESGGAALTDARFRDLPEFLRAGDLLVLNDSRVMPARLFAVRAGVGRQTNSPQPTGLIEVLLVEENRDQGSGNREQGAGLVWRALVRPAKKVRVGETLRFVDSDWAQGTKGPGLKPLAFEPHFRGLKPAATPSDPAAGPWMLGAVAEASPGLTAEVVEAGEYGERTLRFAQVGDFWGTLERIGHMPLPPYIRREQAEQPDPEEDRERYQTVYAQEVGSAAAPTAGLHFTPEILDALRERGVEIAYLTLHVGLGTFQPVRVAELKDIRLHAERYTLPAATAEALNRAVAEGRRVIAVGTTTTRVLEHAGAEAERANHGEAVGTQRPGEAVRGKFEAHSGSTSIFIGPGHGFRVVSGLLTNFHLPESTLLMLVAAFAGDGEEGRRRVLVAYAHAVREGYRFYSYGDCMLLL